ncbi:MAG TPA: hypothetical protein VID30_07875 [Bradyrhizobium sp.]
MTKISMPKFVRSFALAATAALTLTIAVGQRADAMSLITPGATPAAKAASGALIQVRGGHGGGGHGGGGHGGGGFHGGGFHGGGFHGGGFHGSHGGGWRGGGWHGGWHGGGFHHRGFAHFHHRRFFHGGYYPYYGYYHHPRCRVIRTYHGWRRVCGWHRWHHRHYW